MKVEIRKLIEEALRQVREVQPELSAKVDDYAIYNFSIGFEGMGHWETEAENFRRWLPAWGGSDLRGLWPAAGRVRVAP